MKKEFKIWMEENFEKALFNRYEYKDWPEKGNWSKKELYQKYLKNLKQKETRKFKLQKIIKNNF